MVEEFSGQDILFLSLHTLPNEILIQVASSLSAPDLRILGKVNKRLYDFVQHYSHKYRYTAPIWTLPIEILLEVVQHLRQDDRSHFAQSSIKFYPIITDYIYRDSVKCDNSRLLNYAAKRDLKAMTRRLLEFNASLETRYTVPLADTDKKMTPLTTAAYHGHARIVYMLLRKGANQLIREMRLPLVLAMFRGHEPAALLLSRNLDAATLCSEDGSVTVLQVASTVKMRRLVKQLLQNGRSPSHRILDDEYAHNLCNALVRVLSVDFSSENLLKRKLDEDAYQIITMLLREGASPDVRIEIRSSPAITARIVASRHPDPRIRNLLAANISPSELVATQPAVGRQWMKSSEDKDLSCYVPQAHKPPSVAIRSRELLETVKRLKSGAMASLAAEMSNGKMLIRDHIGIPLNAEDIAATVWRENRVLHDKLDMLSLQQTTESSFPQLACPKNDTLNVSKEFWEKRTTIDSRPIPHMASVCLATRATDHSRKSSQAEEFPQLTGKGTNVSDDASKNIWAAFPKNGDSMDTQALCRPPSDVNRQHRKYRKHKKWAPLVL